MIVLLSKPTGEVYAFDGVRKWHIPSPPMLEVVTKAFSFPSGSAPARFDYLAYPKDPSWTLAQHQQAWVAFIDAIPDA
jgi:hypothetical protein